MQVRLGVQCAAIREEIGWEGKSEDVIQFTGETVGDFLRVIETSTGQSFYDRYVGDGSGIISNAVVWHNFTHFVQKNELDKKVNDGDKIIFLRTIPGMCLG